MAQWDASADKAFAAKTDDLSSFFRSERRKAILKS